MCNKVIAVPVGRGGDYLDFFKFEKDNGQPLPAYGVRITWHKANRDNIVNVLKQAKKDYLKDQAQAYKDRQYNAVRISRALRAQAHELIKNYNESMKNRQKGL